MNGISKEMGGLPGYDLLSERERRVSTALVFITGHHSHVSQKAIIIGLV